MIITYGENVYLMKTPEDSWTLDFPDLLQKIGPELGTSNNQILVLFSPILRAVLGLPVVRMGGVVESELSRSWGVVFPA